MDYAKLQTEFLLVVQDASEEILSRAGEFINEACGQAAEDAQPPKLKQPFTVSTVVSVNHADLPSAFSGILTYAGLDTGDLNILAGLEMMMRLHPGLAEEGPVEDVAVEDTALYYQPIPASATSIYCVGYNKPDLLVAASNTPSWCPDYLHREVLVYKAAEIAYNLIEDGVDEAKPNTKLYNGLYQIGLAKFRAWVNRRGRTVTRVKHYI
jgi:hypothetical protein